MLIERMKVRVLMTFVTMMCAGLAVSAAWGQSYTDGAAGGPPASSPAQIVLPPQAGLDDTLQPVAKNAAGLPSRSSKRQDNVQSQSPSLLSLAERLRVWDEYTRRNAQLQLELSSNVSYEITALAHEVEALWEAGQYEAAIAQLQRLEATGTPVAMGVNWLSPQSPRSVNDGADVRLGTRTGGDLAKIDFDPVSGKLFTVVNWNNGWALYMSTDKGVSWNETYFLTVQVQSVDMAVVGDYVYVGYVTSSATNEARLRRNLVSNGGSDTGYSFHTVLDASANAFIEVKVESNADTYNNRIYYAAIQSNHAIRWAWDDSTSGTTFTEFSPADLSAAGGLDMHWNTNFLRWFLFVSYIGTDNGVHVLRFDGVGWENMVIDSSFTGSHLRTAVSAWSNTAICAYEKAYTYGQGITYGISYDAGDTGNSGTLAEPAAGEGAYQMVDITARGGQGTAAVFTHEVGEPDDVIVKYRRGYAPGAWSNPIRVNDFDVQTGTWTALNWTPPDIPTDNELSYGLIYFNFDDPSGYIPYFSRFQQWCCDTPKAITYPSTATNGFFTVSWSAVSDATSYTLERAKDASFNSSIVTVVYTGTSTSYAETGLISGIYYYRVKANNSCGGSSWRNGSQIAVKNDIVPWLMLLLLGS